MIVVLCSSINQVGLWTYRHKMCTSKNSHKISFIIFHNRLLITRIYGFVRHPIFPHFSGRFIEFLKCLSRLPLFNFQFSPNRILSLLETLQKSYYEKNIIANPIILNLFGLMFEEFQFLKLRSLLLILKLIKRLKLSDEILQYNKIVWLRR